MRVRFLIGFVFALMAAHANAQSGEGYWRAGDHWEVTQASGQADCVLSSVMSQRDGIGYRVLIRVGVGNQVVLWTSEPVQADQAAIEFTDGGGLDFYELSASASDGGHVLAASLSSSMMTRLLSGYRAADGAMYVAGSKGFLLPRVPFEEAYQTLRRCERRRLGQVLPD